MTVAKALLVTRCRRRHRATGSTAPAAPSTAVWQGCCRARPHSAGPGVAVAAPRWRRRSRGRGPAHPTCLPVCASAHPLGWAALHRRPRRRHRTAPAGGHLRLRGAAGCRARSHGAALRGGLRRARAQRAARLRAPRAAAPLGPACEPPPGPRTHAGSPFPPGTPRLPCVQQAAAGRAGLASRPARCLGAGARPPVLPVPRPAVALGARARRRRASGTPCCCGRWHGARRRCN
mmetsp:Transcript_30186/g.89591  ORF Transcript_30186/g.89591 Transcript_30186/m.89591 type:complete len:233 (+) Transcript_30186:2313-3011(+)